MDTVSTRVEAVMAACRAIDAPALRTNKSLWSSGSWLRTRLITQSNSMRTHKQTWLEFTSWTHVTRYVLVLQVREEREEREKRSVWSQDCNCLCSWTSISPLPLSALKKWEEGRNGHSQFSITSWKLHRSSWQLKLLCVTSSLATTAIWSPVPLCRLATERTRMKISSLFFPFLDRFVTWDRNENNLNSYSH